MSLQSCLLSESLVSHSSGFPQWAFSFTGLGLWRTVLLRHLGVLFDSQYHDRITSMRITTIHGLSL